MFADNLSTYQKIFCSDSSFTMLTIFLKLLLIIFFIAYDQIFQHIFQRKTFTSRFQSNIKINLSTEIFLRFFKHIQVLECVELLMGEQNIKKFKHVTNTKGKSLIEKETNVCMSNFDTIKYLNKKKINRKIIARKNMTSRALNVDKKDDAEKTLLPRTIFEYLFSQGVNINEKTTYGENVYHIDSYHPNVYVTFSPLLVLSLLFTPCLIKY